MNKQWELRLTPKNCDKLAGKETSGPLKDFINNLVVEDETVQIVIDHIKAEMPSLWSNISKTKLLTKIMPKNKAIMVTQFSLKGKEILKFSLVDL